MIFIIYPVLILASTMMAAYSTVNGVHIMTFLFGSTAGIFCALFYNIVNKPKFLFKIGDKIKVWGGVMVSSDRVLLGENVIKMDGYNIRMQYGQHICNILEIKNTTRGRVFKVVYNNKTDPVNKWVGWVHEKQVEYVYS